MKKKRLVFAVSLVLCLLCTACGDGEPMEGQISESDQEASSVSGEVTPVPEAPEVPDTPVSLGRIQGGIYTNEYMGLACELDSNWEFYSAEELQELPGDAIEMMAGTELGDAAMGMSQIMDMQAENVNEMSGMNILYQKMDMGDRISYAAMTEMEIVESVLAERDMLEEAYAQGGMMVEDMAIKTVTFLGEERPALWTSASVEGVPYYVLQLFDFQLGQYSVNTTFFSYMEDKTESVLALFYKIG